MSGIRRREASGNSDETTLSEGISRALQYTTLDDPLPEEDLEDPAELLNRCLSTKFVISTTSSFAKRMQKARYDLGIKKDSFKNIGLGSCGSVFEIPGTKLAYKKGSQEIDIFRDFRFTQQVHQAVECGLQILQKAFPECTIPKTPESHKYHPANDEQFWSSNIGRFPAGHRTQQPIFSVDHILPLPKEIRDALIDIYFDDEGDTQEEAKNDQDNKDCLIRLYLGERESVRQQCEGYDTLRNFPLRLNMMEDLDLEFTGFAKEMALGLAILHWQAQIDGMDVEFVLGSSATRENSAAVPLDTTEAINFQRREIHLWMFDFDKASEIVLTENDVKMKLVPAFLGNDPYYPSPQVDQELWDEFCNTYLAASELILQEKGVNHACGNLPQVFLKEALRVLKENEDWSEEVNIVFKDEQNV